jgi:hypothetical protein
MEYSCSIVACPIAACLARARARKGNHICIYFDHAPLVAGKLKLVWMDREIEITSVLFLIGTHD